MPLQCDETPLGPADYQSALYTQGAVNLSSLALSFGCVAQRLRRSGLCQEELNRHPIITLYLVQLACLAGLPLVIDTDRYAQATEYCTRLARADAWVSV